MIELQEETGYQDADRSRVEVPEELYPVVGAAFRKLISEGYLAEDIRKTLYLPRDEFDVLLASERDFWPWRAKENRLYSYILNRIHFLCREKANRPVEVAQPLPMDWHGMVDAMTGVDILAGIP